MFGDQLKMADQAVIKLECNHLITTSEMKCERCGTYMNHIIQNQIVDMDSQIEWTQDE